MAPRKLISLIMIAVGFILAAVGCLPNTVTVSEDPVNQATRQAAATAQAVTNQLQEEAFALEEALDVEFSDHYTGMKVETYPSVRVIVYLTKATKQDLAKFVTDPKLLEAIEVREEAITREALREIREAFKAEMDRADVTYTTALVMEPATLEVYVTNIPEAETKLKAANVPVPEIVRFVEKETVPTDG